MRRNYLWPLACATALAVTAGACGGSSKPASVSSSTAAAATPTYTIGLLTDLTGLASQNGTSVKGAEAGIAEAAKAGVHLKLVVDDTQTSPSTALAAATRMVTQQHVDVVVAYSSLTFAAASYLSAHDVPVVGVNIDGTEWLTAENMFSTFGYVDETKVPSTTGRLFQMEGASVVGTLGYGISPSSAESAKDAAVSAVAAGLTAPYVNANFPFGSTNVGPVALAMKNDGVNGIYASTEPSTSLALLTALRQLGVDIKVASLPDGYGGDLVASGPATRQAAQGAYFSTEFQPVEMHTAATERFVGDLESVGASGEPTIAEYSAYSSLAAVTAAFAASPPHPTSAQLIAALGHETDFDAWGLLGAHPYDLGVRDNTPAGSGGCYYYVQWRGNSFHLVPGADPLCGPVVAGKTVSG